MEERAVAGGSPPSDKGARPVSDEHVPVPPAAPEDAPSPRLSDPARLAALYATGLLDSASVKTFERVARLAARALRAPIAQVNLMTDDAQVPKAAYVDASVPAVGDPAAWHLPVGLDRSYCQYVVATNDALLIEDARRHPLVRHSKATQEAGIVAYASVPVRAPGAGGEGPVLGTVCVVDFVPRDWTADDLEMLEELAGGAAAEVARRLAMEQSLASSEARYRALAHAVGEIVWTTASDGRVEDVPEWRVYTGQTAGAVRGWGWLDAVHPDDRERTAREWREAVNAQGLYDTEYRIRGRDGAYRWFQARGVPVLSTDASGIAAAPTIREWVGCCTDIDDARRRTAELEAVNRRLEAANQAKSEFLSTMSHELRTPLNAIGGYAELLELGLRGPVTEAQAADLSRIRRANQHLQSLINDILNFARLESGEVRFDAKTLSGEEALTNVEELVIPQLAARGLEYHRDRPAADSAPALVRADAEKLRQILLNLLTNAIKFTPRGGRISVGATSANGTVAIHVADTGRGIAAEQLERIFEPFVQVDRHLTLVSQQGVGLGLSISRDLARGMHGDLCAQSVPGQGSTFILTLPAAAADAVAPVREDAIGVQDLGGGLTEAASAMARDGVHGVLRYLNGRTTHRFTGLYRFDGRMLRNVALFDRLDPDSPTGADSPMQETYCAIVGELGRFATADSRTDSAVADHPARDVVLSYCGALVRDEQGRAAGTLCHFDREPRVVPTSEIALMEAVTGLLAASVVSGEAQRSA